MFSIYLHINLISHLNNDFLNSPFQINMVARLLFAWIHSFIFTFNSTIFSNNKQRSLNKFNGYLCLLSFHFVATLTPKNSFRHGFLKLKLRIIDPCFQKSPQKPIHISIFFHTLCLTAFPLKH